MTTDTAARDHLAAVLEACPGCAGVDWVGSPEELDEVRRHAGLPARSSLEHALQWARHIGWELSYEDESLFAVEEFGFDVLRLVREDPGCVKTTLVDALLHQQNPTCGTKGCGDHRNGPVLPSDPDQIPDWQGLVKDRLDDVDEEALVLFTIDPAGDTTWARVQGLALWVVWLDQAEALTHRRSPRHRLFSQSLGLARRELHDQGDGLLVVRGGQSVVLPRLPA